MPRKSKCLCGTCPTCEKREYDRKWREKNREKLRSYQKEWHAENREDRNAYMREHIKKPKIAARRAAYTENYQQRPEIKKRRAATAKTRNQRPEVKERNREASLKFNKTEKRRTYMREYCRESRANNLNARLAHRLRSRLSTAVRGKRAGSAVRDLGCSIQELRTHLESKFEAGMSWENWGNEGWHIDHIQPLISFNLSDREQLLEACHYSNLQPLWAIENRSKKDRVVA